MSTLSTILRHLRARLKVPRSSSVLKLLVLLFAFLNLKSLPFAWHLRLIWGLIRQLRTSTRLIKSDACPSVLFQPIVTKSRSGFLECDYNLHKSNSTYFSDFDVGRLELLVGLLRDPIERVRKELDAEVLLEREAVDVDERRDAGRVGRKAKNERLGIPLGGVACNFRREIRPYEAFEVWTRILTWDRKWLYVVGHFVKKGVVKPKRYTLSTWLNGQDDCPKSEEADVNEANRERATDGNVRDIKTAPHPAIFASAIAKYCFKYGRRTIPPERILRASGLLPLKPTTDAGDTQSIPGLTQQGGAKGSHNVAVVDPLLTSPHSKSATSSTDARVEETMAATLPSMTVAGKWTWEKVEDERRRGLKVAERYSGLDALNYEFLGDEGCVLNSY